MTNSGEGLRSMRLADRKVVMEVRVEICGKTSTQSWAISNDKRSENERCIKTC
jgi:hypothetical protein